jgi:hypothetical protein
MHRFFGKGAALAGFLWLTIGSGMAMQSGAGSSSYRHQKGASSGSASDAPDSGPDHERVMSEMQGCHLMKPGHTVLESVLKLPSHIASEILKDFHHLSAKDYRKEIADLMLFHRHVDKNGTKFRTFSDKEIKEVLLKPSRNFQTLQEAILLNRPDEFPRILRASPEVLFESDQHGQTLVDFAIQRLSLDTPCALKFLKFIVDQRNPKASSFFSSLFGRSEYLTSMTEHLLALEPKGAPSTDRTLSERLYEEVLDVATKMVLCKPSLLNSTLRGTDLFPLLAKSHDSRTHMPFLSDDFYMSHDTLSSYSSESWHAFIQNWKTRRAEKIRRLDELYNLLQKQEANVDQMELILKDPSHRELLDTQDQNGQTLLMRAAKSGNLGLLKALIGAGAQVDVADSMGFTALHLTLSNPPPEFEEAFNLLIEAGSDVNTNAKNMGTPLFTAVKRGLIWEAQSLLQAGASVDSVGERDGSLEPRIPLLNAVKKGDINMVRLLLKFGADVNVRTARNGTSPLIEAMKNSQLEMVQRLLKAGARSEARDDHYASSPAIAKALRDSRTAIENRN